MKIKFIAIVIIFTFFVSNFIVTAELKIKEGKDSKTDIENDNNLVEIQTAIFSNSNAKFTSLIPTLEEFETYQWKVGNTLYKFKVFILTKKDIYRGRLSTNKYDLLIIPANEGEHMARELIFMPMKQVLWKKNIADFIKDGGGYVGYCASSYIMAQLESKINSIGSKALKASNVGLSQAKIDITNSYAPFLPKFLNSPPGSAAYVYFSDNNMSKDILFCGVSLDVKINKDNPIFDDFIGDTRRIRWIGGLNLIVPEDEPDNNITVIGYFPDLNISKNSSTDIYEWEYKGGLLGFLKGFKEARKHGFSIFDSLSWIHYMATDWECSGNIIETHHAGKPFMTMETYPNENKARIILSSGHPEYKVWWGGEIINAEDTDNNKLWDGLHNWVNISSYKIDYNSCIVRRHVAWVSKKVPDNDLPPVYGPSQVSDIIPYDQTSSEFTIYGNSETSDGVVSLDLFYRYSCDNKSWCDWTLYDTDFDGSDGWSWEFNSPNGTGYYQFYSIRQVIYEHERLIESDPPGADAIFRIID